MPSFIVPGCAGCVSIGHKRWDPKKKKRTLRCLSSVEEGIMNYTYTFGSGKMHHNMVEFR